MPCCVPVDVLVMGTGDHDNRPSDAGALFLRSLPAGVVKLGPELVVALLQLHRRPVDLFYGYAVEVGSDRVWSSHLGHRPVERAIPGLVLGWMTGATGVGRDVPVRGNFDGAVRDLRFWSWAATREGEEHSESQGRYQRKPDETLRRPCARRRQAPTAIRVVGSRRHARPGCSGSREDTLPPETELRVRWGVV